MVLLILDTFKTNMNLGVITSLTTFLYVIILHFYKKKKNEKIKNIVLIISSIIPLISLIFLLFYNENMSLIIYNFCFVIFTNLLKVIRLINLYTVASSKLIGDDFRSEFITIREIVLDIGRIFSYILLLFACLFNNLIAMNLLLILLTFTILLTGILIKETT